MSKIDPFEIIPDDSISIDLDSSIRRFSDRLKNNMRKYMPGYEFGTYDWRLLSIMIGTWIEMYVEDNYCEIDKRERKRLDILLSNFLGESDIDDDEKLFAKVMRTFAKQYRVFWY